MCLERHFSVGAVLIRRWDDVNARVKGSFSESKATPLDRKQGLRTLDTQGRVQSMQCIVMCGEHSDCAKCCFPPIHTCAGGIARLR